MNSNKLMHFSSVCGIFFYVMTQSTPIKIIQPQYKILLIWSNLWTILTIFYIVKVYRRYKHTILRWKSHTTASAADILIENRRKVKKFVFRPVSEMFGGPLPRRYSVGS